MPFHHFFQFFYNSTLQSLKIKILRESTAEKVFSEGISESIEALLNPDLIFFSNLEHISWFSSQKLIADINFYIVITVIRVPDELLELVLTFSHSVLS